MPKIRSAKKALRQNITRRKNNLKRKEAYKAAIKEIKKALTSKDTEKAKSLISKAFQTLDKAAKLGVIKKNKSSRLKSRLSRKLTSSKS